MAKENDDLAYLAMWLHTAAKEAGQVELVRGLIKQAWTASREMYGLPAENEAAVQAREIPTIISEFAAEWDEHDLLQRLDQERDK